MKNKILNNGFGIGNLIFIAALVIALPLRIYQYVGGVLEPVTGFFTKNDFSVYALYGVIIISAIAVYALGFINRKKLSYEVSAQKNPVLGAASALVALAAIIDASFSIDIMGAIQTVTSDMPADAPERATAYTTAYIIIAQAAISLLAAMFFAVLCINSFMGKTIASELRLLSLAPVLWTMLRMGSRLTRTISFTRVSELLFEMFMLAFMICFFMNFAQCNSKVNDKDCAWKVAAFGLPAALLGLICFVPRVILSVAGKGDAVYAGSVIEFSDVAVALFVIAAVITNLTDKIPETEESAEATSAESDGETVVSATETVE